MRPVDAEGLDPSLLVRVRELAAQNPVELATLLEAFQLLVRIAAKPEAPYPCALVRDEEITFVHGLGIDPACGCLLLSHGGDTIYAERAEDQQGYVWTDSAGRAHSVWGYDAACALARARDGAAGL